MHIAEAEVITMDDCDDAAAAVPDERFASPNTYITDEIARRSVEGASKAGNGTTAGGYLTSDDKFLASVNNYD